MPRKKPMKRSTRKDKARPVSALVANKNGEIVELAGYGAVGMAGTTTRPLFPRDTLAMPHGGEVMYLPDRVPILQNLSTGKIVPVAENPFQKGEPIFPVASFNSPGYVHTFTPAYEERPGAAPLPLFAYGAVGWWRGEFRSAVFQVDRERRQDLRLMPLDAVRKGARALKKKFPDNCLRRHIEKCALTYGCPAAKNFFIGRCEAPLPTSSQCNARCLGCLSLQGDGGISHCQDRINFTPAPADIAQIALTHIERVKNPVVSFGQGCEGDPLLAAHVIEPAIEIIRSRTSRGTINMNTNGSLPAVLTRLFSVGLDSIRVSLNSVRERYYNLYFRPQGYRFTHVLESIAAGISAGKHVAINYLNMAGFTDTPGEKAALMGFLETYPIHQIQWRNMNFDPLRYWQAMAIEGTPEAPVGMKRLVDEIKTTFPQIRHGYFNPPIKRATFKK